MQVSHFFLFFFVVIFHGSEHGSKDSRNDQNNDGAANRHRDECVEVRIENKPPLWASSVDWRKHMTASASCIVCTPTPAGCYSDGASGGRRIDHVDTPRLETANVRGVLLPAVYIVPSTNLTNMSRTSLNIEYVNKGKSFSRHFFILRELFVPCRQRGSVIAGRGWEDFPLTSVRNIVKAPYWVQAKKNILLYLIFLVCIGAVFPLIFLVLHDRVAIRAVSC